MREREREVGEIKKEGEIGELYLQNISACEYECEILNWDLFLIRLFSFLTRVIITFVLILCFALVIINYDSVFGVFIMLEQVFVRTVIVGHINNCYHQCSNAYIPKLVQKHLVYIN